jgi:hypothetical protein
MRPRAPSRSTLPIRPINLEQARRNGRKYKTYVECTEASYFLAWKPMEVWWYCSNLAFNK